MIEPIANILVDILEVLPVVDRITGIVQPIIIKNTDLTSKYPDIKSTQKNILVPGAISIVPSYEIYLPDSRFKSILFFEVSNEVKLLVHNTRYNQYECDLDLCVWFNYKKLNMIKTKADFMNIIMKAIPDTLPNNGLYTRIYIELTDFINDSKQVYDKYNLDETIDQYLMWPYDGFKIRFKINFTLANICITDINNTNPAKCSK